MRRANRRPRRRQSSEGQVIMAFALMFSLFIMGLIGMVINLGTAYGADAFLRKAAQDGAIAGAAQVDIPTFRTTGKVALLAGAANTACNSAITQDFVGSGIAGAVVTCAPQGGANANQIIVTVSYNVKLPLPMGVSTIPEKRTYTAFGQCGTTTAAAVGC